MNKEGYREYELCFICKGILGRTEDKMICLDFIFRKDYFVCIVENRIFVVEI